MYIDLNWEVKTNAEFKYKLKALTADIKRLEKETDGDPHGNDKIASRIIDIYRLCKYNAGLLVPYFFPQYPYNKPLSCSARPYSFAMFHMQIGGFLAIRAGRQIGKSTSLSARQLIYAHIMSKRRSMYIVPHQSFLDTYANRVREMERAFRFYQVHKDYRQNLKYKEYPNESVTMLVKCLTDTQEARSKTTDEALFDECQLLDPDFLPDIEQCQKASRMPTTIYAGTSTTTDSLLETKFLDSSQAAWLLRTPGYHS
jgi:hypothetical protein